MKKAERVYRWFVNLYPKRFKERFATELVGVWKELYREHTANKTSRIVFWGRSIGDVLMSVIYEHITKENIMNQRLKGLTRLPKEVLYLGIAIAITTILTMLLLAQSGAAATSNHSFIPGLAISLVLVILAFGVINTSFLLKADEIVKKQLRTTVQLYSAGVITLFIVGFFVPNFAVELTVAMITLALVFLSRPLWQRKWFVLGAVATNGLLVGVLLIAFTSSRFDPVIFNSSMLLRAEQELCRQTHESYSLPPCTAVQLEAIRSRYVPAE
jgi:hypothetical protein